VLKNFAIASLSFLFCSLLGATYTYEANKNLFDLTGESGTTSLNSGDDSLSSAFNLDFTFGFYGESFTSARMATNGCLHFGLGTGSINYNNYCGDYTPDPLPHTTYTLYPFYTDLIRDSDSKMLAKNFTDKAVFGWYNLREYNRSGSDNSFEVILWTNDTYEFRYGELDIIKHDVLIGEQGNSTENYTYVYFDECSTGTTNSSNCVSYDWNSSSNSYNTALEDGGSLANNEACLNDPLSHTTCPTYNDALFDYECERDSQHSPSCPGYSFQDSVAYFDSSDIDYGYEEDYYLEELYLAGSCMDDPSYCYDDPYYGMEFTDAEWYEIDLNEFGQEQVDDWYGTEVEFNNEGYMEWESSPLESWEELDYQMDLYDNFNELSYHGEQHIEVFGAEELIDLYTFDTIIREGLINEEENYTDIATLEELDEWFEEEMQEHFSEEEMVSHEEEFEEDPQEEHQEEIFEEEAVEEIYEEIEERVAEEEIEREEVEEKKGGITSQQLNVVAQTILVANNSVNKGSFSNTSNLSSQSSEQSDNTKKSTSSNISGISTSSSPSISDQIQAAQFQTNTVLSMNDTGAASGVNNPLTTLPGVSTNLSVSDAGVKDIQVKIDAAVSGTSNTSEADTIANQIIAQNIKDQQEEQQSLQEETGKYGDETSLIAYLDYVPGFDAYRNVSIPKADTWYESKTIYEDVKIKDNVEVFYSLASTSFNKLDEMLKSEPRL